MDLSMKPVSFAALIQTEYGPMIVHRMDEAQGVSAFRTGVAHAYREIDLLRKILATSSHDKVFLDVGSNVGFFTIALARDVGDGGLVHAFEPQRIIFNMLAGSVALNGLRNVFLHNVCVGDQHGKIEVPQFDYTQPLSFGSVEFGPEQREALDQLRQHDLSRREFVPVIPLDGLELPSLDLIKIDVEGMEMQALAGAEQTLRRFRPILYIEYAKVGADSLRAYFEQNDYIFFETLMFNFVAFPRERLNEMPPLDLLLEGVRPPAELPAGFDPARYLERNPDLARANVDPVNHYMTHGWLEKRIWR
jgi:FkbM family methyltransferase